MAGNVLFVTVDQWRGDCLSAVGHPLLRTPALDRLAASGTAFANHWANAAPCGPSRACLYTGTYLHRNRAVHNGTPLDARFTNLALLARQAGYRPALFGYTDTSVDPRTVDAGDPRLFTYEGVLPGFHPVVVDAWEDGSREWGKWLADHGVDVPANPHHLYRPIPGWPGADDHGPTWAPARFPAELSQTAFVVERLTHWLDRHGDRPFFVHASFIRPHPPRRNPVGYHDRYAADDVGPFAGADRREEEMAVHPLALGALHDPAARAPEDDRDRRQLRATYYGAQQEVDDRLGDLFGYLDRTGLARDTLVVLTSDHGDMAGDHWLVEKLGYWDESYHVPLVVRDPRPAADGTRGTVVRSFTESVDVLPTICEWIGVEVPLQADGWSLLPFLHHGAEPEHWRQAAHWEWDFSNPATQAAERSLGVPMSHCSLAVSRTATTKYVQFATDPAVMPPVLFDLDADPQQLHNLAGRPEGAARAWEAAQELLQWRMRTDERTLSGSMLTADKGLVAARDRWR
ncbi:MAG TPA: sulfatase-like hydrolase/transferase [Acidimicrobiales bacterium]|nr:sulfatase-like hydrolase/transferase [Acidimicrobiales bacterium]